MTSECRYQVSQCTPQDGGTSRGRTWRWPRMATVIGMIGATVVALYGSATAAAIGGADLAVTVESSAPTLVTGSMASFTVTVTNVGAVEAHDIRVDEVLPTGFDLGSSNATLPAAYDPESGWTLDGPLPAGDNVEFILHGVVSGAATPVVAVATAHGTGDVNLVNNTGIATIDVTPGAGPPDIDLDVSAPSLAHPGETIELVYSLTNTSRRGIDAATVTIPMPGALELTNVEASEPTSFTDDVWSVTSLAPNATATLRLTARVAAGAGTQVVGTAYAECGCIEEQTDNNHAEYLLRVEEPVEPAADLVLVVTPDVTTPAPGALVTATYSVVNSGDASATRPMVSTAIPPGASLVGADVNPGGSFDAAAGEWDLGADLMPSEGAVLTLTLRVLARSHRQLSQTSFVSCPCDERTTDNNVSQYTLHVGENDVPVSSAPPATDQSRASLSLQIMGPPTAHRGRWVTYRLVVTNVGSRAATGVRVRGRLPGNIGRTRTQRNARLSGERAAWTVGVLQPGERRTLAVRVRIDAPARTSRLATAEVTGDEIRTVRHRRSIRIIPGR